MSDAAHEDVGAVIGPGERVLVAGCGDLGTEVGLRLHAAGVRVCGLRRRASLLPAVIEPVAGDLARPLPPLTPPPDVAAVVLSQAADERTPDAYRRTYVDGTRHVLDALDAAGVTPRRVLLVSSTAVYGVGDGSEVDEDTPTLPGTPTGKVVLEAEEALRERRPDAIVLRLGGVYGPGRTWLVDQVRAGTAVVPDPPAFSNRIHRDDAADAVVHLLTRVTQPQGCYLGVDDDPAEHGEVLRFLAGLLGVPPPPSADVTRRRSGDKRCANARLRTTGWVPQHPTYREGYRAVLAGVGKRHS